MRRQQDLSPATIPYDTLASGIQHGPYLSAPDYIIDLYMNRHKANPEMEPTVSAEQKLADIESEWQYDQHSEAVMKAVDAGRISNDHAYFMLEKVLRPWFIGHRNPGE